MSPTEPTSYDPFQVQAAAPATHAYAPNRPDRIGQQADEMPTGGGPPGIRLDGLAIAAMLLVAFLVIQSIRDRSGSAEHAMAPETGGEEAALENTRDGDLESPAAEGDVAKEVEAAPPLPLAEIVDPGAIAYPYDNYWVTQGPHGFSYGHMAIDIAAGKGAPVKSPIHGTVTANYVDQYGNTTLVIENEVYRVTLLHGDFSAQYGQKVGLGDVVGTEGNNGYTTDMQGRSCRNRDCGYHSHLNVFSKVSQSNVNPLDVLQ